MLVLTGGDQSHDMQDQPPDLIFNAKAQLGEGAIWHHRQHVLYWVDILGKKFWQFNPATGRHEDFETGQFTGTIVPRHHGGVLLAFPALGVILFWYLGRDRVRRPVRTRKAVNEPLSSRLDVR